MKGVNISQQRAYELSEDYEIFLSPTSLFWLSVESVSADALTHPLLQPGDKISQKIPDNAFPFSFEITLTEAATNYPLAYSTLAEYARNGKLDARRSAGTWLTTRQAVERLIAKNGLKL